MIYPIAIEIGDENTAFGVVVPDIEGCFSAGDTLEEALSNTKEAMSFHLEEYAENGKPLPIAGSLDLLAANPEYQGFVWMLLDVDESTTSK